MECKFFKKQIKTVELDKKVNMKKMKETLTGPTQQQIGDDRGKNHEFDDGTIEIT